jgi:hypothetical protein
MLALMPTLEEPRPSPPTPAQDLARWDRVEGIIYSLGGPTAFAAVKVADDGRDELDWGVWFLDGIKFDIPYDLVRDDPPGAAKLILARHAEATAR